MTEALLYGRLITQQELPEDFHYSLRLKDLVKFTGFIEKGNKWFCRRCRSEVKAIEPSYCLCNQACGYCTECIKMGKIKRCTMFYHIKEPNKFPIAIKPLAWEGQLSKQQQAASDDIIQSILKKETRLIWAVAGAGKTEMLFEGIEVAIEKGSRIAIASPRVDVCLELYTRLQAAFPSIPICLLYGAMDEPYQYRQLTIATTYQLMRFKEAFDLLIIDEIDAFPFDVERTLQVAAFQSRKKESTLIYLSATPNHQMQKDVAKHKLNVSILPARYHGYPLPVPRCKKCAKWKIDLLKVQGTNPILKRMKDLVEKKKKFLVFIPNIKWCQEWEKVLAKQFSTAKFACVHSSDPDRKEKVMQMREDMLDFLVTTTILERGVTFINIDVLVVGADDRIFTESSLVQIAGRAGRSPQYPTGDVTFYFEDYSLAMKRAVKQIKTMNQTARKRGLLHGK